MKKRNIDFGKFFNFFSILKHPAFITMSLILFIILYFLIPMNFFETDFYFNVSGTDNSIFQISDTETPYIFYILHKQAIYYEIILIILNVVYYFYIDEELDSSPEFFVPYVLLNVIVLIGAFLFAGIMYISSAEQLKLKRVFITPNGNLKTIIIGNKTFKNPFYYDPIKHKLYIYNKNIIFWKVVQ